MYDYHATVVRWIDGDTVVLILDQGFGNTKTIHCRLLDCWAPKNGTPLGEQATARVNALMPPGTVSWASTVKPGTDQVWKADQLGQTFSRWLGVLYLPRQNTPIGDVLIAEGLATRDRP